MAYQLCLPPLIEEMESIASEILETVKNLAILDFLGLTFGLLNVFLLIRQNILTWAAGIIYVVISLIVFWEIQLYGDFLLHIIFLILNIYGWWFWVYGKKAEEKELAVTSNSLKVNINLLLTTAPPC